MPRRVMVRGRLFSQAGKASRKAGRRAPKPAAKGVAGYFQATKSIGLSLVLTLPVLILYNFSLIVPANNTINAVDLLSRVVGSRYGLYGLLIANGAIGIASLVLGIVLARRGRLQWWYWPLLMVEGALWAAIVGFAGHWANTGLREALQSLPPASILKPNDDYSLMQILTFSAGAGYWEELIFRLGMVGIPWAIARWWAGRPGNGGSKVPAIVAGIALIASSVVFSLVHYIGGTENPDLWSFTFRTVSGLVFGLLFIFRGWSVAVFSHFMYDIVAFWLG